jgi:hypothetical protein
LQLKLKAHREVLEFDLARAKQRAQRLEEQLSQMEANQDQTIQRQVRMLIPDRNPPRRPTGNRTNSNNRPSSDRGS